MYIFTILEFTTPYVYFQVGQQMFIVSGPERNVERNVGRNVERNVESNLEIYIYIYSI